jgi:hypothetical protein
VTDDSAWTCPHCGHEVAGPPAVCDACGADHREPPEEAYVHRPVSEEYDRADVSPSRRALLAGAGVVAALAGLGTTAYATGALDSVFAPSPPVAHRAQLVSEFEYHGDLSANAVDSVEAGETGWLAFEYSYDSLDGSRNVDTRVAVTPTDGDRVAFEHSDVAGQSGEMDDQRVQTAVGFDTSFWEPRSYEATVAISYAEYESADSVTVGFDVT